MSLTLLAAVMGALLVLTVAMALWRCSHPFRMRYTRCSRRRVRLCRELPPKHSHIP